MNAIRISIVAESTGLTPRSAIAAATKMGAGGIEFDAAGDLLPDRLGETARREFRNLLRSHSLDLCAINIPLRNGLDEAVNLQPRIDRIRDVMQLSFDLGARRVVVPFPRLPGDTPGPGSQHLRESLDALGRYGDRVGTVVALEFGFDASERVVNYLTEFDSGSLKLTFDPANMLLHGLNPLANLAPLKGWLAHFHARDARGTGLNRGMQEVRLGAGDVDWLALATVLQVIEYDGFIAVKRDQGESRLADIEAGVTFLRRFVTPRG